MAKTPSKPARDDGSDNTPAADEQPAAASPAPPAEESPAAAPAPDTPDQTEVPEPVAEEPDTGPEQLPPGVYEYVAGIGCVYPHVPLTCRAFHPVVEATETRPEIPEQAATVFEWLDGPPADGRWAPTEKTPNQVADNSGGLLNGKE
ncbi:hypothetical protein [Streptomyces prunicolor]|uniref:hypothetical protein n=1 Tax=Streptomyces prunicolor TaxID=67348 RepID=UPI000368DBC9|nr:hypothetical protein [Streptomyces prunicolor]